MIQGQSSTVSLTLALIPCTRGILADPQHSCVRPCPTSHLARQLSPRRCLPVSMVTGSAVQVAAISVFFTITLQAVRPKLTSPAWSNAAQLFGSVQFIPQEHAASCNRFTVLCDVRHIWLHYPRFNVTICDTASWEDQSSLSICPKLITTVSQLRARYLATQITTSEATGYELAYFCARKMHTSFSSKEASF